MLRMASKWSTHHYHPYHPTLCCVFQESPSHFSFMLVGSIYFFIFENYPLMIALEPHIATDLDEGDLVFDQELDPTSKSTSLVTCIPSSMLSK